MPKRTDLKSVLVVERGSIIIGQACEFDHFCMHEAFSLRVEI